MLRRSRQGYLSWCKRPTEWRAETSTSSAPKYIKTGEFSFIYCHHFNNESLKSVVFLFAICSFFLKQSMFSILHLLLSLTSNSISSVCFLLVQTLIFNWRSNKRCVYVTQGSGSLQPTKQTQVNSQNKHINNSNKTGLLQPLKVHDIQWRMCYAKYEKWCARTRARAHTHTHTQAHTHRYTRTHTHTHTHTHTRSVQWPTTKPEYCDTDLWLTVKVCFRSKCFC